MLASARNDLENMVGAISMIWLNFAHFEILQSVLQVRLCHSDGLRLDQTVQVYHLWYCFLRIPRIEDKLRSFLAALLQFGLIQLYLVLQSNDESLLILIP